MPKYEVLARSYIGNTIVEPGEVVEYGGAPGSNLKLVVEPEPAPKPRAAPVVDESILE